MIVFCSKAFYIFDDHASAKRRDLFEDIFCFRTPVHSEILFRSKRFQCGQTDDVVTVFPRDIITPFILVHLISRCSQRPCATSLANIHKLAYTAPAVEGGKPQGLEICGIFPDFYKTPFSHISRHIGHIRTGSDIAFRCNPAIMSAGRAAAGIRPDEWRRGIVFIDNSSIVGSAFCPYHHLSLIFYVYVIKLVQCLVVLLWRNICQVLSLSGTHEKKQVKNLCAEVVRKFNNMGNFIKIFFGDCGLYLKPDTLSPACLNSIKGVIPGAWNSPECIMSSGNYRVKTYANPCYPAFLEFLCDIIVDHFPVCSQYYHHSLLRRIRG